MHDEIIDSRYIRRRFAEIWKKVVSDKIRNRTPYDNAWMFHVDIRQEFKKFIFPDFQFASDLLF